jgi:hypothetical protein
MAAVDSSSQTALAESVEGRMHMTRLRASGPWVVLATLILGALLARGLPAWGFDPAEVYRERALVLSGEAGYGSELHVQDPFTGLDFVNAGIRLG